MKRLRLLLLLACSGALLSASFDALSQDIRNDFIKPPYLKAGDKVAVIATSFQPGDSTVARTCRVLRKWGLNPVVAPNITAHPLPAKTNGIEYYPGDSTERTDMLRKMLNDKSIKALFCARGGYGAIHLLDSSLIATFKSNPKWLIGYSDITTFHCALVSSGMMSIHGNARPSSILSKETDECAETIRALLFGKMPCYFIPHTRYDSKGTADGIFVGGNMITMAALAGTGYDPTSRDGIILFIEEVGETWHAIDRLFNMLLLQGKMKNVRGIIVGEFTRCIKDLPYDSIEQMLSRYTSKLGIPVCYGFPAGHGKKNMPLVEGAKVIMNVTSSGTTISFM